MGVAVLRRPALTLLALLLPRLHLQQYDASFFSVPISRGNVWQYRFGAWWSAAGHVMMHSLATVKSLKAGTLSASSTSTATGSPIGISFAPSPCRILAMYPSSCVSHSMVALSVSTSAMICPGAMASPSFFFQEAMLPCGRVFRATR